MAAKGRERDGGTDKRGNSTRRSSSVGSEGAESVRGGGAGGGRPTTPTRGTHTGERKKKRARSAGGVHTFADP